MAQSVDEILDRNRKLAGPAQEKYAEGEMRKSKAGAADNAEGGGEAEQPRSLRERVIAARRAMNLKQRAKDKLKEKVMAPAKAGTNSLLRFWWATLIPSWGLSLIGINIHVFLRFVLGERLFCKLGEEWLPKKVSGMAGDAGKATSQGIGIIEVMVLIFLNLLALFIVLSVLVLFSMVVSFMGAGLWDKIKWIWDAIETLGWGAVLAIKKLFS